MVTVFASNYRIRMSLSEYGRTHRLRERKSSLGLLRLLLRGQASLAKPVGGGDRPLLSDQKDFISSMATRGVNTLVRRASMTHLLESSTQVKQHVANKYG